jgi:hypothetical protein
MRKSDPPTDPMAEAATQLCVAIVIVGGVAFVGWKLFGRFLIGPH